ncbi:hypothetical protein [Nitrosomonas sp. Nm34]|uniref:hypothetical protein n=1 Tax=Nitrosomonas sp. Nm34 TaxID=1881055 RepID=UPI0008E966A2|nr:hypothetical protein [Nitrosomonas sp. Nm34]SFJ05175.1 hypothetical protein SAMN05428978_10906 [Nitrosomonas sp. Nm34]
MNEKYIWPLIGVILGWLLSLLSSGINKRSDKLKSIGRLISKLLFIHEHVQTLQNICEHLNKYTVSWKEFENSRKLFTERYFLEPPLLLDSLQSSIEEISGIYPVEALKLHKLVDRLLIFKKAPLTTATRSDELYEIIFKTYVISIEICKSELNSMLRFFALRHGLLTFFRVLQQLAARNTSKESEEFTSNLAQEFYTEINRNSKCGVKPSSNN